jgi:chemotaxis protein histidine kinase CheA
MPGKIFVNYRRDDERAVAARVRDRLAQTFGEANVFMDVDNLLAGQRFDRELEKALEQTDVFVTVIGPRWLDLLKERQSSGERDYVHEEIAGALRRGVTVIPLLVERTPLPRADTLPEDIQELVLHQKHDVTHEQFGRDVVGLVEAIQFARTAASRPARRAIYSPVAILAALGVVTIMGGAFAMWVGPTLVAPRDTQQESEQVTKAEQAKAARSEAEKARKDEAERKRVSALKAQEDAARAEAEKRKTEEAGRKRLAMQAEEERKRTEVEAATKRDEDARTRAETLRQRLATLKAMEDAKRADEDRKRIEAERQRLAMLKAEEDKKRAEAEAAAVAGKKKKEADEGARAKANADEAKRKREQGKSEDPAKVAALPKIEKALAARFDGNWTFTWTPRSSSCRVETKSYSIVIANGVLSTSSSGRHVGRVVASGAATLSFPSPWDGTAMRCRLAFRGRAGSGTCVDRSCTGTVAAKRN